MKLQKNLNLIKKNVLLRVDLNVPKINNKLNDDSKIIVIQDTLKDLVNKNNKIFLLSHFGRPKAKRDSKYSLKFLTKILKKFFVKTKITFLDSYIDQKISKKISLMKFGEICLLENVRFHKGEKNNTKNFSKKLSKNFDIYINDAFSASHRSHASIVGVTKFLPSYAGLLFEREFTALTNFINNPKKPSMAIIGGSKVSTKILLLKNLVNHLDYLVIAGGMANTFLAAKNYDVGKSFVEKDFFKEVKKIERNAKKSGCKLILPLDVITSSKLINAKDVKKSDINRVEKNKIIYDIGNKSCEKLTRIFSKVKTVLWNGPLGAFEYKPFNSSTTMVAKFLSKNIKKYGINVIVGGGDTIASLKNLNVINKCSYVSTSGGAFLEFLEGKELPGIKALKKNKLH